MSKRFKLGLALFVLVLLSSSLWVGIEVRQAKLRLQADLTYVCQQTGPKQSFYGPAGRVPLTLVNFVGHQVQFHPKAAPYLAAVSKEIEESKINYRFDDVQTFNADSRSGYGPSFHTFGLAIDVNPVRNPSTHSRPPITDIPSQIIDIFKKYGFGWGGDWQEPVDPMHFEWYGGGISGSILAENTGQKISKVKITCLGIDLGTFNEMYEITIPAGQSQITATTDGFYILDFRTNVPCNSQTNIDLKLKPVAKGAPVRISGKVFLPRDLPLTGYAEIYIDGIYAGVTDEKGEFTISNVPSGMIHTIEARFFTLQKGFIQINLEPGGDRTNLNIVLKPENI